MKFTLILKAWLAYILYWHSGNMFLPSFYHSVFSLSPTTPFISPSFFSHSSDVLLSHFEVQLFFLFFFIIRTRCRHIAAIIYSRNGGWRRTDHFAFSAQWLLVVVADVDGEKRDWVWSWICGGTRRRSEVAVRRRGSRKYMICFMSTGIVCVGCVDYEFCFPCKRSGRPPSLSEPCLEPNLKKAFLVMSLFSQVRPADDVYSVFQTSFPALDVNTHLLRAYPLKHNLVLRLKKQS